MPFLFTCSRCGENLKDHWLVCKHCHQPRWNIIAKYFIYGGAALAVAFAIIVLDKNQNLACAAAILAASGVLLLSIAVVGTLLGLTAKKEGKGQQSAAVKAAITSLETPTTTASNPVVLPVFVDRLGSFIGSDEMRISNIDSHIRGANHEPQWEQLALVSGQVERGQIPLHMRETIDTLVDLHVPTSKLTFEHLLKLGDEKLRETIIRILGAMGTENVLPVLQAFANRDPLRVNEDDEYNSTTGPYEPLSISWVMPLRKLAEKQLGLVKTRLGKS